MTCHIRLWFDGHFDRQCLQQALACAVERHPLFQMLLSEPPCSVSRRLHWRKTHPSRSPEIHWQKSTSLDHDPLNSRAIMPHSELGVKLFVVETEDASLVWVQFHHVHGDGTGMFFFLEDIFSYYDHLAHDQDLLLRPIDVQRLSGRDEFGLTLISRLSRVVKDSLRVGKFFRGSPVEVSPIRPIDKTSGADIHSNVRIVLDAACLDRLQVYARKNNVTVNDLLLKELFVTTEAWNRKYRRNGKIRVAMPIDLRVAGDELMPCANVVSMCFIDHKPAAVRDELRLLKSIHRETREIINSRMGITLNRFLNWALFLPGIFKSFLHNGKCKSTVVLTNIGRPFYNSRFTDTQGIFRLVSLSLIAIDSLPPVREKTNFSISVNRYGGKLSITARFASNVFSKQEAQIFVDSYASSLTRH